MRPFAATAVGYEAELEPVEREVIASVVADVVRLLGAELEPLGDRADVVPDPLLGSTAPLAQVAPPEDTAVRRLFPDASFDDPEVAGEFRRLTEVDLREAKVARLVSLWQQLREPGEHLHVDRAGAGGLAAALTDVRLVLADRLGLADEPQVDALYAEIEQELPAGAHDAQVDPRGQRRRFLGSVYALLTFVQESLVTAMLVDLPDAGDAPGTGGRELPA